jgi:ATP-dependent protease HslVU (ClpYQ) peptidase subunit
MSNVKNYTEQGGEKTVIGGELEITAGGKLTFEGTELKPAAVQVDSEATTIAGTVADLNALLAKLKAAGLMASE